MPSAFLRKVQKLVKEGILLYETITEFLSYFIKIGNIIIFDHLKLKI